MPIVMNADILIVIGTSLNVYPAAGLVHHCSIHCTKYLVDPKAKEINIPSSYIVIEKTAISGMALISKELGL